MSARLPPRYPLVGKIVEGDEAEEGTVSYWRHLPDTHKKERLWRETKSKRAKLVTGVTSPIPTGRKNCGGR